MKFQKEKWLADFYDIKLHFIRFLRHPLQEIQAIPDWHWEKLLFFQVGLAAVTGAIGGLLGKKFVVSLFVGIFFSPILTLITLSIATLFFYYCFQIFAKQTVSIRKLFTLILFANIPQFIFQIISNLFPPIILFGIAFTAALLIIGFVTHFNLEKKKAIQLVAALYVLFFAVWLTNQISTIDKFDRSWSPETIEAPEVELGK